MVGKIEGNLTNITDTTRALLLRFDTATYANQSRGAGSVLSLYVSTETFYDATARAVYLFANVTILGHFAPNLLPGGLQLTVNETGPAIGLHSETLPSGATNVTFGSQQVIRLFEESSSSLSGNLINADRADSAFNFGFYNWFEVVWRPQYNHFVGFRVTVTGPFSPAVEVGVLLKIINDSGGRWPLYIIRIKTA